MSHDSGTIRILAVDDHQLIRQGIAGLIADEPGMTLVAEATNGREAIDQFRRHRPDVTLMDLQMPELNGIEAMTAIRAEFPEARIIVLTTYTGDVQVLRAIKAGASGYLLKSTLVNEMLAAIRAVHAGRKALSAEVSFDLAEHAAQEALSPLEVRVLRPDRERSHEQGDRRQALRHRGGDQEPGEKHPVEAGHGRPHACSRDWTQAWHHRAVGVLRTCGHSRRDSRTWSHVVELQH